MSDHTLPSAYFDTLYKTSADPWRFETSVYEAQKYAATLAALPAEHYTAAIEVGCSIGVLTRQLADRCDSVLGLDIAQAAIDVAKHNGRMVSNLKFKRGAFPDTHLDRKFDLILLSEVLYYFSKNDVTAVAERVRTIAHSNADIVCVHWLGPTPDYPITADQAMAAFERAIGHVDILCRDRQPDYRLDVMRLSPND